MSKLPDASKPRLRAILVYDGDCGFCTRSARWFERRLPRPPIVSAWQDIPDLETYGLRARECHDAVQYVDDWRKESGARAIGRMFLAQGGVWRLIGWPPFLWPFSAVAEALYKLVARNRYRLPGGTASCEAPQTEEQAAETDDGQEPGQGQAGSA